MFGIPGIPAQAPEPPDHPSTLSQPVGDVQYLLLSPPRPEQMNIPAGLNLLQASRWAEELAYRQAEPGLQTLQRLQKSGSIASFEVLPQQFAVAVQINDPSVEETLQALPNISQTMSASLGTSCSQGSLQALQEQVLDLSHMQRTGSTQPESANATDPSISVYAPPEYEWTRFSGSTFENIPVTMRILRGGKEIVSGATTSDPDGDYYFYPEWIGGCDSHYAWVLQAGDVVEVTAHGNTVSTVVARLSAWVDPAANTVAGVSDPGRTIVSELYASGSDLCYWTDYTITASTDESGSFLAKFGKQVDFDRHSDVYISAQDANGNETYVYVYAYHIYVDLLGSSFGGALRPNTSFTATLSRSGSPVDSITGVTSGTNWYYGYFDQTLLPGDVIAVSGGEESVTYTIAPLNASVSEATNQVSGVTGSGRRVLVDFDKRTYGDVITSCSYDYHCAYATTGGDGAFSFTSSFDLVRGDYAYITILDGEGNYQETIRTAPAIVAKTNWDEASGYWGQPGATLTVTLKNSSNAAIETLSSVWTSSWNGSFSSYFSETIEAGDHIEVTDGTTTETMTVQNVTAALNNNTKGLSGSAPNGHLVGNLWNYQRSLGEWWESCGETNVLNGSYDINYGWAGVGGMDYADVYGAGPDGHYTSVYAPAFQVKVEMDGGAVSGQTMSPGINVQATLWNGSTLVSTQTTTSSPSGDYSLSFANPLLAGQRVKVVADLSADITLPNLILSIDPSKNRITGSSPAGEPLVFGINQWEACWKGSTCWMDSFAITTADNAGAYSAAMDTLYFQNWETGLCSNARVDGQCAQPYIIYYRPDGHSIQLNSSEPPLVTADSFENDDTQAAAVPYTESSAHTFHTGSDVDWISLSIGEDQVGKQLELDTIDLGKTADTVLRLYDVDGTTLLAADDDSGPGFASSLVWTPPTAGVYYVRIKPYDGLENAGNCGASYSFVTGHAHIYIPVVSR